MEPVTTMQQHRMCILIQVHTLFASQLSQQLRMAGTNPKQPNRTASAPRNPVFDNTTYPIRGCDGTFGLITSASNIQSLTCSNTTSTLPDSIAISYEADRYNTSASSGGAATDCVGSTLVGTSSSVVTSNGTSTSSSVVTYTVADNRFYIGTATSAGLVVPSLYCKGSNSSTQPLVENIEDMQFTYGTSPAGTATSTVAGYLAAVGVETDTNVATGDTIALSSLTSAQRWGRVITVRICVLARSEIPLAPDTNSAKYVGCNGAVVTPSDLRLRRAYHTTVVLRNRLDY